MVANKSRSKTFSSFQDFSKVRFSAIKRSFLAKVPVA